MSKSFLSYYNEQDAGVLHPAYTFANKVIKILKSDNPDNYDPTEEGIEIKGLAPRIFISHIGSPEGLDDYGNAIYLPIITETQSKFNIRVLAIFLYKMAIQKFKKEVNLRDWIVDQYYAYYGTSS